jgi:hypothetical protein
MSVPTSDFTPNPNNITHPADAAPAASPAETIPASAPSVSAPAPVQSTPAHSEDSTSARSQPTSETPAEAVIPHAQVVSDSAHPEPSNEEVAATTQKCTNTKRRKAAKVAQAPASEPKKRPRFKGVRHGFTASIPVIPGENPAVYKARVDSTIHSIPPRNQLELDLMGQASASLWLLERAVRSETATLRMQIRHHPYDHAQRQQEDVATLGRILFFDPRGPWQAYPHAPAEIFRSKWDRNTSWSPDPTDLNNPAKALAQLEKTETGCQWILDRWDLLESRLVPNDTWTPVDQFMAIRLLGKQPLDAVCDDDVALICLASARLSPEPQANADPFAAIKHEIRGGALSKKEDDRHIFGLMLKQRRFKELEPPDAESAREALRALVNRERTRVKRIQARIRELARIDRTDLPDSLVYDGSKQRDQIHRYVQSWLRSTNQTIKLVLEAVRGPFPEADDEDVPSDSAPTTQVTQPGEVAAASEAIPAGQSVAHAESITLSDVDSPGDVVPLPELSEPSDPSVPSDWSVQPDPSVLSDPSMQPETFVGSEISAQPESIGVTPEISARLEPFAVPSPSSVPAKSSVSSEISTPAKSNVSSEISAPVKSNVSSGISAPAKSNVSSRISEPAKSNGRRKPNGGAQPEAKNKQTSASKPSGKGKRLSSYDSGPLLEPYLPYRDFAEQVFGGVINELEEEIRRLEAKEKLAGELMPLKPPRASKRPMSPAQQKARRRRKTKKRKR